MPVPGCVQNGGGLTGHIDNCAAVRGCGFRIRVLLVEPKTLGSGTGGIATCAALNGCGLLIRVALAVFADLSSMRSLTATERVMHSCAPWLVL